MSDLITCAICGKQATGAEEEDAHYYWFTEGEGIPPRTTHTHCRKAAVAHWPRLTCGICKGDIDRAADDWHVRGHPGYNPVHTRCYEDTWLDLTVYNYAPGRQLPDCAR